MNESTALDGLSPYYAKDGITLYCARSEKVLPRLRPGSVDALITDPPYGNTDLSWDKTIDWKAFWPEAIRICKPKAPMVLFSSGKFVIELINSNLKHYRYELIWEKNMPTGHLDANRRPLRSHETILVFSTQFRGSTYNPQMVEGKRHIVGNGKSPAHYGRTSGKISPRSTNLYHPKSILRFDNSRKGKSLHPTQKPLDLMEWLVRSYSNRFDTILDPFAGSGSTLVAAARTGRRAIGVEQNRDYCDTIVERLKEAVQ